MKKQDETDDLIDANVETKLEKLDLNSETLLENGTKESTKTRIDNPKRENDQHDDRPNFKNLDQLVQKRNDSRASSSSSNSRRFEFIRGLKEENERVPSPSSSSSSSSATKTSQNNFEKSLNLQFQELMISKICLLLTLGQKVECGKEEEVEVEVVSVSEAEVVSEVEELGLEVVVEVAQEEEGQWC